MIFIADHEFYFIFIVSSPLCSRLVFYGCCKFSFSRISALKTKKVNEPRAGNQGLGQYQKCTGRKKSAFAFEFRNFIALLLRVSLSRLLFASPSSFFFMLFLPFCLHLNSQEQHSEPYINVINLFVL
jgi:hypothetical protein